MTRARGAAAVLFGSAALFALSAAAPADRLVLRDGRTIETRGAVKLDPRRAVYTDLAGNLVALRIEEVDVVRTQEAAKAAAAAAPLPAAAVPPKAPVLRLTDDDVGHSDDSPASAVTGTDDAVENPVVTLYSTSWCGWCRKSRSLMQSLGIAFVEKDVERDPRAAAEKARLAPGAGVPVLVRGSEIMRGFSEAAIRSWAPAAKAGQS